MFVAGIVGFAINTAYAITQRWSLQEFCWGTWLAALFFSWTCIAVDFLRIIFNSGNQKEILESRIPVFKNLSPEAFLIILCPFVLLVAWVAFRIYCFVFAFYGLFLSVWAEMEPHSFFGRNGFINSDFFSPVVYLARKFWPMILGLLISDAEIFLKSTAWKLLFFPFQSGEIIRIHLMVLVMPFLCMLAWAVNKNAYQPMTIILLLGLFYLPQVSQQFRRGFRAVAQVEPGSGPGIK